MEMTLNTTREERDYCVQEYADNGGDGKDKRYMLLCKDANTLEDELARVLEANAIIGEECGRWIDSAEAAGKERDKLREDLANLIEAIRDECNVPEGIRQALIKVTGGT